MPLDPRLPLLAGQGVTPVRDPLQTMGAVYQLQGQQQEQQVRQLQLAEAQRQEQERGSLARAFQGAVRTDPATGKTSIDMPAAFSAAYRTSTNPLAVLKAETEYGKSQAESRKSVLEAQKVQLEQGLKGLEFGGQVAQGVEDRIAAGADPQVAWQWGLETMRRAGLPTQGITPTYDANMLAGWKGQALAIKDKLTAQQKVVDQQLREYELAETQKRTQLEARRAGLEERRVGVQEQELGVKREDIAERRAERMQTREQQQQQRLGERENQLRDEFTGLTKNYREVRDAWGRIETTGAATPTVANDYALIYSFMKMLDPMTGIRDAETRSAVEAGGLPAQTQRWIEWVQGNKILPDNIRQQFVETGKRLYDQYTREYDSTRTQYQDLAKRYGADPANVTLEFRATPVPRQGGTSPYGHLPATQLTPAQRREELDWLRKQRPTP